MKKLKFYFSLLKERDWLEEMARKGFLLKNITMGVWYEFEEGEPCEKVYEIENFACGSDAAREELCAREHAFEIAEETGWKVVTHDEAMNYYFVKDRAGDESDEFYEDAESRRKKAEKVRKIYAVDMPKMLISMLFIVGLLYALIFILPGMDMEESLNLHRVFFALTMLELVIVVMSIYSGESMYKDMILSREEWELKKKYSEKISFRKAQKLLDYLQKKDHQGLKLVGCKENIYHFAPTKVHYQYYLDTQKALKKRCKENGDRIQADRKDIAKLGMAWQEQSMKEAGALHLEVVGMAGQGTLIYRKNADEPEISWNENVVNTSYGDNFKMTFISIGTLLIVGFAVGFICAMLGIF